MVVDGCNGFPHLGNLGGVCIWILVTLLFSEMAKKFQYGIQKLESPTSSEPTDI